MFRNRQVPSTHFGLQYYNTIEAKTDPMVYPRYTILPKKPNYAFSIPSSSLILVEPAGNIPISILTNKFMKNCVTTNRVTKVGLISDGK